MFCTPCNRASFGMVLLEAMSCGRPVVASRISGFQLVMEDGEQGYMVDPADSAERFAAALGRLLDSDALTRIRMGAAGRREASSATHGRASVAQLETYYRDLIAGRQPTWANARSSDASTSPARAVVLAASRRSSASSWARVARQTLVAIVVLALMLWTWGAFTPNSRVFGQRDRTRLHRAQGHGDDLRRRPDRRVHARRAGRAARRRGQGDVLLPGPKRPRPS